MDYFLSKFSGRTKLPDESTDYEAQYDYLCKTDQVVHFFENDIESYLPYVPDVLKDFGIADTNSLDNLKVEYINAVNGVNFQDKQIATLVDEFVLSRDEYRAARPDSRKNLRIRIAGLKCDIEERLNKRNMKDVEKQRCLSVLRPLISKIKLSKILPRKSDASTPPAELMTTTIGAADTTRQRRPSKYSVDEVKRIINKKPEFLKIIQEYMSEISDPAARREHAEYLTQLEKEGEVPAGKILVKPDPWLCFHSLSFCLNITTSPSIEPVSFTSGLLRLPFVLAPVRSEQGALVVDAVVNANAPTVLSSSELLVAATDLIIDKIEQDGKNKICRDLKKAEKKHFGETIMPILMSTV